MKYSFCMKLNFTRNYGGLRMSFLIFGYEEAFKWHSVECGHFQEVIRALAWEPVGPRHGSTVTCYMTLSTLVAPSAPQSPPLGNSRWDQVTIMIPPPPPWYDSVIPATTVTSYSALMTHQWLLFFSFFFFRLQWESVSLSHRQVP